MVSACFWHPHQCSETHCKGFSSKAEAVALSAMSTQTLYDWKGSNLILWIIAFRSYLQDNTHQFLVLVSVDFSCLNSRSPRKGTQVGWIFCTLSICHVDMWLCVNPSFSWPDLNSQSLIFDSSNIWNSQILWILLLHWSPGPGTVQNTQLVLTYLISIISIRQVFLFLLFPPF